MSQGSTSAQRWKHMPDARQMPPSLAPESTPRRAEAALLASDASPVRIRHVDSLRAVAAGFVVWTHLAEVLAPVSVRNPAFLEFLRTLPPAVNLGRVGVLIFFAVSGFVICRSFGGPREGGGRRFGIKRLCRLYPAFAASLPAGMLVWSLQGNHFTWPLLAANLTMVPALLGQPLLLGLYWTLAIEVVFYALCLGLYRAGALDRQPVWWAGAVGLADLPRLVHLAGLPFGVHYHLPGEAINWTACLAVMFWGAVFRMVYDETGGFRRGTWTQPGTYLLALLTAILLDLTNPGAKWSLSMVSEFPWHAHLSSVYALTIFTVWVAILRVDNTLMTLIGVISYSWYLFHPVVLYSLVELILSDRVRHQLDAPLWVTLPACAALSVALAMIVHRWVERPGIALGKKWAAAAKPVKHARALAAIG